jgi:hypothetical protein
MNSLFVAHLAELGAYFVELERPEADRTDRSKTSRLSGAQLVKRQILVYQYGKGSALEMTRAAEGM